MKNFNIIFVFAAVLVATHAVAESESTKHTPVVQRMLEETPSECGDVSKPICCRTRSDSSTVSNRCVCSSKGGPVVPNGRCLRCSCPKLRRPVCCRLRNGRNADRPNECRCTCRGGRVISNGSCSRSPSPSPTPRPRCICTRELSPVCCKRGNTTVTETNTCNCRCGGGTVSSLGACEPPRSVCACPKVLRRVCCLVDGTTSTKDNSCECGCSKGEVVSEGSCKL